MQEQVVSQNEDDKNTPDSALIVSMYGILASRRLSYDALIWQVPTMSFTAQAFLFATALISSNYLARLIAAILALVISLISMQLMSKHRYHEEVDARLLEKLEKSMNIDQFFGVAIHARPRHRAEVMHVKTAWYGRLSSYHVWMVGLALFAIASVLVIGISLFSPTLL